MSFLSPIDIVPVPIFDLFSGFLRRLYRHFPSWMHEHAGNPGNPLLNSSQWPGLDLVQHQSSVSDDLIIYGTASNRHCD